VLTPESSLIREEFDRNDIFSVRRPHRIADRTFHGLVDRILVQAGVKEVKHKTQDSGAILHKVKRCHGFRKFYVTNMIKAKVDWGDREYLTGHKHSRGLDENYDRTDEDDRLKEYLKAVDLPTITEESKLKAKVKELTNKQDEMTLMKVKQEQEMKRMREDMELKFQQILAKIDVKALR
jgi:hypothetical protein